MWKSRSFTRVNRGDVFMWFQDFLSLSVLLMKAFLFAFDHDISVFTKPAFITMDSIHLMTFIRFRKRLNESYTILRCADLRCTFWLLGLCSPNYLLLIRIHMCSFRDDQ